MPTDTPLKLIHPDSQTDDRSPLERRGAGRHIISGRVTALQRGTSPTDYRNRICSFQLLNISDTGLGVLCQEQIVEGEQVAVFFPPHGPDHGFDLYGLVVRCVRRADGHEIGIRFEQRAAA